MKIFPMVSLYSSYSCIAPVDTLDADTTVDIAVEETTAPSQEAPRTENFISHWYTKLVLNPSKSVFYHIIPKCTPGTQFEYLFPITMIWSLILVFLVTYVIAAVCQRWETLLVKVGFISF